MSDVTEGAALGAASHANDPKLVRALTAAQLYYLQDLTMDAIARELHTSRSSVSRLISHARETGLVDIRIHSPLEKGAALEQQIRDRFGIAAHVVPVGRGVSEVDRLERVAMTAARLISQFVDSNMAIGVAWGYHSVAELTNAGAHRIIESFTDLPAAIDIALGAKSCAA